MAEFVKRGFRDVPQEIKSLFPAYFFHVEKSVLSGSLLDVQDDRFIKKAIKAIRKEAAQRKDAELKRAIKIASKRIESVDVEYADTLFSIFVQKRCWRSSRIRTRVEEDVDMPEFKESPLNIDFPEKPDEFESARFCTIGVEHKNRDDEPHVRCWNCNGSGSVKCEHCEGTGREQFVDGYYASGEERIKTGNCPECHGSGRATCPECNGEGRIAVFAREYSLVSFVQEEVYHNIYGFYWTPWDVFHKIEFGLNRHCHSAFYYCPKEDDFREYLDRVGSRTCHRIAGYKLGTIANLSFTETRDKVSYQYLNRKTLKEDHRNEIQEQIAKESVEEAYRRNVTALEDYLKTERGLDVKRAEQNYVIPAALITLSLKDGRSIPLMTYEERPGELQLIYCMRDFGTLDFWPYFFSSIYYLLVSLGRAVYKAVVK